jgi:hypothetical protein
MARKKKKIRRKWSKIAKRRTQNACKDMGWAKSQQARQ